MSEARAGLRDLRSIGMGNHFKHGRRSASDAVRPIIYLTESENSLCIVLRVRENGTSGSEERTEASAPNGKLYSKLQTPHSTFQIAARTRGAGGRPLFGRSDGTERAAASGSGHCPPHLENCTGKKRRAKQRPRKKPVRSGSCGATNQEIAVPSQ